MGTGTIPEFSEEQPSLLRGFLGKAGGRPAHVHVTLQLICPSSRATGHSHTKHPFPMIILFTPKTRGGLTDPVTDCKLTGKPATPPAPQSVQTPAQPGAGSRENKWERPARDPHQALGRGLGGEPREGMLRLETCETKLNRSRGKGEREGEVALRVAELSGACVFPW